ncbi:hypothetical protein Hypma_014841 [Hypsizygus marmoreus]|uniref:DUF7918 domain-containing protein n=1 Tax=Hypsizygus marmoreus TaxID=39966 RepID=A0A369KCM0_HYPMA|nr:hypothetical protein Hypma_014841 [Hypsizygus marmoreus]
MLQIGSFSAWVSIDDNEVPQYAPERSEDGTQVLCWIASEAGKNFSVSWKNSGPSKTTSGKLYVDGESCGSRASRKKRDFKISGVDTSPTTQRLLMFSRIELTDDDAYLNLPTSSELGDIKLEVHEVAITGDSREATKVSTQPKVHQTLHERAKKGSMHCFNLGKEIIQPRFNTVRSSTIRIIGTFVFKYRPLELLQANGLAPIEKKRKPTSLPRITLDLTDDNAEDETTGKIRKLEAELKALKQVQERNPKRVKTEIKNEPLSGNIFQPGEIIDLT